LNTSCEEVLKSDVKKGFNIEEILFPNKYSLGERLSKRKDISKSSASS